MNSRVKAIMPPKTSSKRKRGQKREVVFDPEARKAYLRGFSERKRQRRAYGLAMQRVKDRKAKIEQRAQEKKDDIERIEEAEKQKEVLLEDALLNTGVLKDGDSDGEEDSDNECSKKESTNVIDTKTYDDKATANRWGGQVTVSVVQMGDSDEDSESDDDSLAGKKGNKTIDSQQKYAGNVEKYMNELKGNMPSKKNKDRQNQKRRGKNGAADMKGMGGAANLKIAQKLLTKTKAKQKPGAKSSKKRKGRR